MLALAGDPHQGGSTMWPVLQRELRELARQPAAYWLRVLAAVALMVPLALAWTTDVNAGRSGGRGYFMGLHRLLLAGIWIVGPVLTADCLSRERREGTLGLLFLTPLRPFQVIIGKTCVQALRGLIFLLAASPVLVIPVVLGGVVWWDAVRMFLLELAALGLALVTGLLASCMTESWWRARILALLLALGGAVVFVGLYVTLTVPLSTILAGGDRSGWDVWLGAAENLMIRQGLILNLGFRGLWMDTLLGPAGWPAVRSALMIWVASWSLVAVAVGIASIMLARSWQGNPPSIRRVRIARWFTEVRVGESWWRRRQSRILESNPILWLQSRTWSTRVGGWVLLGMALSVAGLALEAPRGTVEGYYFLGHLMLLGGVAFAAAASFRIERESGALELWLVTPLTPTSIVRGRILGLARRFLWPTLILWLLPQIRFVWRWYWGMQGPRPNMLYIPTFDWLFGLWVLATLVFGVGLALSRFNFLTSFALAWVAHHVPFVLTAVGDWLNDEWLVRYQRSLPGWPSDRFVTFLGVVLAVSCAAWGWWFACRQLDRRRFLPGIRG